MKYIICIIVYAAFLLLLSNCTNEQPKHLSIKTVQAPSMEKWMWLHGDVSSSDAELEKQFEQLSSNGITGVLIGGDHEKMFRAATNAGIQAHIWIWTLNRGNKHLMENHPEWYSVNRQGVSCVEEPPYVGYYRWLCPSNKEVITYLEEEVSALAQKDYIDGIHLDYVRYCDVILPRALWGKYGLVQDKELPQFDYCYCSTCRDNFKNITDQDPLLLPDPPADISWVNYRYDRITQLVNRLSKVCHDHKKPISAAVFPTPAIAKKLVRQDWVKWDVDRVFPMVYHGFYNEDADWIQSAVEKGIHALNGKCALTAGVYMPDLPTDSIFRLALDKANAGHSNGIAIFGKLSDSQWSILKRM
jgi:uncharacterized lipoprotein YddW (UPF0748 family)